jgi:hypothetical protein
MISFAWWWIPIGLVAVWLLYLAWCITFGFGRGGWL